MNDSVELFGKQREIGRAIWLLIMYWSLQGTDECSWAWVRSGLPICDGDVATHFGISVFTAARWREKLRHAGVIQTFPRERGFSVFAYRPAFATMLEEYLEGLPTGESWPPALTSMVQ
jgi:hypothetical protein